MVSLSNHDTFLLTILHLIIYNQMGMISKSGAKRIHH